jgi:hypothetical protein
MMIETKSQVMAFNWIFDQARFQQKTAAQTAATPSAGPTCLA